MLTRWNPLNDFMYLEKSVRDLFVPNWRPAIDVYEGKEKITLEAELPGMALDDVKITVDSGVLTIKGEKKFSNEHKDREYFRMERSEGSFVRSFTLPKTVDPDGVEATYKDGILTVVIPKKPEKKPKEINIKGTS